MTRNDNCRQHYDPHKRRHTVKIHLLVRILGKNEAHHDVETSQLGHSGNTLVSAVSGWVRAPKVLPAREVVQQVEAVERGSHVPVDLRCARGRRGETPTER